MSNSSPSPETTSTVFDRVSFMASRTFGAKAATLASSFPACAPFILRSTAMMDPLLSIAATASGAVFRPRWASSSSEKPRKKLTDRLSSVIDAFNDRKLPPELRGQRNAVRSETDLINVVEQRIWHSMEEGQFENLPGKGKPLDLSTNPHADPTEDTLYRILSKNGCAPEWVELNKEIRGRITEWRMCLKKAWAQKGNGDDAEWNEHSEALKVQLRDINDKVFRYNLIVPFGRQMFGLKWEKELDRLEEAT